MLLRAVRGYLRSAARRAAIADGLRRVVSAAGPGHTQQMVLQTLGQQRLLERKPHLDTAVRLRAPHIDALSQIQLRALRVLRGNAVHVTEDDRQAWRTVLLLTVNGLAAGLQNTG